MLYPDDSPVAQRILAIDEEIAALDGAAYRTVMWSGAGLVLIGVVSMMLTFLAPAESTFGVLSVATAVAVASLPVLALHLSSNRALRRRLERELDSLLEQGSPT